MNGGFRVDKLCAEQVHRRFGISCCTAPAIFLLYILFGQRAIFSMVLSMTGFGRGEVTAEGRDWIG